MMSSNGNILRVTSTSRDNPPVISGLPHTGQWRRALMFSLIFAWTNRWANHQDAIMTSLWCKARQQYRHTNNQTLQEKTLSCTVYPKKYAHGFCFAVLCCGYTLTDFPISIRLTSLALWQSNDCPSASKATLMNMDKYFMWIHYEQLHNHNKANHNKTVCIFLGIYCTSSLPVKSFCLLEIVSITRLDHFNYRNIRRKTKYCAGRIVSCYQDFYFLYQNQHWIRRAVTECLLGRCHSSKGMSIPLFIYWSSFLHVTVVTSMYDISKVFLMLFDNSCRSNLAKEL